MMINILNDFIDKPVYILSVLNVNVSVGIIDEYLLRYFH